MSEFHTIDPLLALKRLLREASFADGPEEALWVLTRALPSLVGPIDKTRLNSANERNQSAATVFMLTPDRDFHLITAPVNFPEEQYHEKIAVGLGHPAHIATTRHPLLLRNTTHHQSFVKILQTFRAGSAMFAPLMWGETYLGVLICANSAPEIFTESDLLVHEAIANAATAVWMAHSGPAWMKTLDYAKLPERHTGE